MKRLLFISIFLFIYSFSYSQSVLEQSIEIYKNEEKLKKTTSNYLNKREIIDNYFIQEGLPEILDSEWDALDNFNKFLNDPFQDDLKPIDLQKINNIIQIISSIDKKPNKNIEEYLDKDVNKDLDSPKSGEFDFGGDLFNNASFAATPGINFSTKLIDGTASLIAGKIKTELSISFYEKMTSKLRKEYNYDFNGNPINISFQDLLPNSATLISTKQTFEVPAFGATWVAAFKTDLNELPFSLMSIFENDPNFMKDDLGRYAAMIFDGLDEIYNGNNVYNTIETMSNKFDAIDSHNLDYQLNLLFLIAKNSQNTSDETAKSTETSSHTLLNSKSKKYYVGLIYQDGLQMGLQQNSRFVINDDNYIKYYEFIKDVQFSLNKFNSQPDTTSKTTSENLDFIKYATHFTEILHTLFEFDYHLNPSITNNSTTPFFKSDYAQKYVPVSKSIVNFYNSMNNNNYGGSVLASINFLNYLSNDEKNFKLIRDLTFYGSFLADMVVASKDDNANLQEIMNRYAMPVTSYRVKRYYKSSIDISAYPGINFSYEFSNSKSPSFGISAPIGFSFSWRSKNTDEIYVPSHTLFISAIDIGAPVSYRLLGDTANGLPENIKWEQVFSPGIYYMYGFKNTPLSLSIGVQYTPLLRKIETESVFNEENVLKAGISLTVDLPLFSLYKNSKNLD